MPLAYLADIDDFLGSRATRYFGNGYLNSRQSIRDFKISGSLDGTDFTCVGSVDLPDLWSQKGEQKQTPHLSTIDVIEFSLECLRVYFMCQRGVSVLPSDYITELSIVAGNAPIEGDLKSIPITGTVSRTDLHQEVMEMQIANMVVTLILKQVAAVQHRSIGQSQRPVQLGNVMYANHDEGQSFGIVKSALEVDASDEAWSVAACFACALQLGQLLLYKMDQIQRANSNTLWMKRTTIRLGAPLPIVGQAQPMYTHLESVKRYTKADGDWRRADIVAAICNTEVICVVTHRLPEQDQSYIGVDQAKDGEVAA